jgi:replication fork clamp-binding protein CrfC
VKQDERL